MDDLSPKSLATGPFHGRCTSVGRHAGTSAWLLVILFLPTVVGCGSGLAKVSGAVTMDGEPLRSGGDVRAMVYFYPEDGTGAPAVGLVDEAGQYSIATGTQNGVKPGAYLVSISASQLLGEAEIGVPRSGRRITPAKYADPRQSGLRVEVAKGSNTFDFALEADQPSRRTRR